MRPGAVDERWEKATHVNGAGFWVDFQEMAAFPAMPLQYLRRLELVNEVFADDIHFEGVDVGPRKDDCRLRISQPGVVGDAPEEGYLLEWLRSFGFEAMTSVKIGAYDARCCRRDDIWLFDVRPKSFVMGPGDVCFPIDVLVQREGADEPAWW